MREICNLGHSDRALRALGGLAMLALGWFHVVPGLWSAAFQLFGWFPLVTGIAGWCPVYVLFGFRTRTPH